MSPARLATLGAIVLQLAGCGDHKPANSTAEVPPAVTVVKVVSDEVRPSSSFTGRVTAKDKVDLRARVDGFLEKRLFTEGADVKEGDLLFVIEKGQYQDAVEQAKGRALVDGAIDDIQSLKVMVHLEKEGSFRAQISIPQAVWHEPR